MDRNADPNYRALRFKWQEAKARVDFLHDCENAGPGSTEYADAVSHQWRVAAELVDYNIRIFDQLDKQTQEGINRIIPRLLHRLYYCD